MRIVGAVFLGLIGTFALLLLSLTLESRGVPSEVALAQSACATAVSFGLAVAEQPDNTCRAKAFYKLRGSNRAVLQQRVIVEIPLTHVIAVRDTDYDAPMSEEQRQALIIAYSVIAACFFGLLGIGVSLARGVRS